MKKLILTLIITIFIFGACTNEHENTGTPMETEAKPNETYYKGQDASLFTAEKLFSTKRLSDAQLQPGGDWILYRLSIPVISENKIISDIFAVKTDGSETKRITNDNDTDFNPRWSPDGKEILYISVKDGSAQAYKMAFPDGSPQKITDAENGVSLVEWSPDGSKIYFSSDVKIAETVAEQYPDYSDANVHIYTELPIRHWNEWTDEKASHLFVQPVNDMAAAKDLMEGQAYETPLKPYGGPEEIAWAPDGMEIAYTVKEMTGTEYVTSTNSDIFIINTDNGTKKNITSDNPGYDKMPLYSPDGKYIAFTRQVTPGFEADKIRLMLYDRANGSITDLTESMDQWAMGFTWSPDSKKIYFTATDSGRYSIFGIDVATKEINRITPADAILKHGHPMISADGGTMYFTRESFTEPSDLYSMSLGGTDKEVTRVTNINKEIYETLADLKIEEQWIKSFDGEDLHVWMVYPPNFDPNKKYPMISYCQGGPQSMISPNFHYRWNLMLKASQGYIVMAPNRRGLPGFGQAWNDAISLDWGGAPMKDILAATDHFKAMPYVDEEKLACVGASAGGYAAFWLAGHHEGRFKAFLAHCGVFNLESMYGSTEELFFPNSEYGGPYWDPAHLPNFRKNSPHNYVANWDTPIIISTGMGDYRVPYTQSLEAFTAARAQGIPAKILVYPEETHFILKPHNFIVWHNEYFDFLGEHVLNN
jgi:dipeptidyl aminopeptidase/acylaminoacyl peptidase